MSLSTCTAVGLAVPSDSACSLDCRIPSPGSEGGQHSKCYHGVHPAHPCCQHVICVHICLRRPAHRNESKKLDGNKQAQMNESKSHSTAGPHDLFIAGFRPSGDQTVSSGPCAGGEGRQRRGRVHIREHGDANGALLGFLRERLRPDLPRREALVACSPPLRFQRGAVESVCATPSSPLMFAAAQITALIINARHRKPAKRPPTRQPRRKDHALWRRDPGVGGTHLPTWTGLLALTKGASAVAGSGPKSGELCS